MPTRYRSAWIMIGTFLAILMATPVWGARPSAQTTQAVIYGVVQNADGTPLAGASITVRNPKGTAVACATTDSRGMYRIVSVAEGVYEVEVRHEGYTHANRSGVVLRATSQQRVDFNLTPNSVS